MSRLTDHFSQELDLIEAYLADFFENRKPKNPHWKRLYESVQYSVGVGGKRFRPVLSVLTAKLLDKDPKEVLPFAAAVEFIHTYSLIHDDLPIMDDDDERRGKPTNHKVYGEVTALLAGDGLQSLAFEIIAFGYPNHPEKALKAVQLLAIASGLDGMVGGQVIDVAMLNGEESNLEELTLMHSMKTGALIRVAVEGAAVVCGATGEEQKALRTYGENVGLAFQLADDLLDYDPKKPEKSGFPYMMGVEKTKQALEQAAKNSLAELTSFGDKAEPLKSIANYNLNREF